MARSYRYFIEHFFKSELIRNISILFSGTVLAQVITILLQPVLRRLFSADTFGVFSVYSSIIAILSVLGSFRYEDAIVLPKKDKEATNLIFISLLFNLLISILVLLIIVFFGHKIGDFLNIPDSFSVKILLLIPLSVLLANSFQYFNLWLIRKKMYVASSVNKLIRRLTEGIAQVVFALTKNSKGLIISDIIGQGANLSAALYQGIKSGFSLKLISKSKIKYILKKYSDFPKYNLITSLASTCSYMLPPIFINKYFSPESAGYFDFARVILSVPIIFLTVSFSNVLLQKISERYNNRESMIGDLKYVLVIVLLVAIGEVIIVILFGEKIFSIIGGPGNSTSGIISKTLVWSFAFNFIVSSFTSIFIAIRRIKYYSFYQGFYFLAILTLLLFKDLDFQSFLRVYVIIELLCYIVLASTIAWTVLGYERSLISIS